MEPTPGHAHPPRKVKSQNLKHKSKDGEQQGPPVTHSPEMGTHALLGHGTPEQAKRTRGGPGAWVPLGGLLALPCSLEEELVVQTLCAHQKSSEGTIKGCAFHFMPILP